MGKRVDPPGLQINRSSTFESSPDSIPDLLRESFELRGRKEVREGVSERSKDGRVESGAEGEFQITQVERLTNAVEMSGEELYQIFDQRSYREL